MCNFLFESVWCLVLSTGSIDFAAFFHISFSSTHSKVIGILRKDIFRAKTDFKTLFESYVLLKVDK